ncbi:precorrin-2 dehydrogenase/sirohydrochlorin ferrochelatase family protein [Ekhidna sp.]
MSTNNKLFPIFLKLNELNILLVGGGNVALEKLQALLKNDPNANVKVVADFVSNEVGDLIEKHSSVRLINRKYISHDLESVDIAILATDSPALHNRIRQEAKQHGVILNVADTPHLCDFYLGATVSKGNLKLGISTNGMSPTFAKRLREFFEQTIPDDTDELLKNLRLIRDRLKGDFAYKVEELNKITKSLAANGLHKNHN